MGREVRMRESDSCEANDSHVGVDVFQNALCEENQPHRQPDQQYAAWGACGFEEELKNFVHQWITFHNSSASCFPTVVCLKVPLIV
jgi:hypothetical protein